MPALHQPWKCIAVLKSQTAGVHCSWPAQESWLLRRHMAYTCARQGAQLNAQHIMAQPEVCNASWFIVDDCWLVGWLVLQRRLFADAGSASSCYVHGFIQYPLVGASTSQPRRYHFPAEKQDHGWKDLPLVPKPLVLTSHLPFTRSLLKVHLTGGSHCLASSRLNW